MTITWQQTGTALFIALALHGSIAFWLTLPTPEHQPAPPEQTLRVSLLATIAETHTAAAPVTPPPQSKAKPPIKPKPEPKSEPKPEPKPVTQEPIPEPFLAKNHLEIVEKVPTPLPESQPVEPSPAPLSPAATAQYEQLFVAWLEKHKKYPRRAKRMRIEGEGWLRISINRTGQIQSVILEQSTGNRLLDKAALEMAERANPFPAIPDNDPRQELEFIVPVGFALR